MSRNREPIDLIVLKGKAHLTKEQILNRRISEAGTPFAGVPEAPDYLTENQAAEFNKYAVLLDNIGLMSELYADSLGRYVIASDQYYEYQAAAAEETDPKRREQYITLANTAFNQAHKAASVMCLTPESRRHLTRAGASDPDEL